MWYNALISLLARSPLHGLISHSIMLITYNGRKSGKVFTVPVNYLRMESDGEVYFLTTSLRKRAWWRNLRRGAEISVRLQGKKYAARAETIEDPAAVAESLTAIFEKTPEMARYMEIKIDQEGKPDPADLAREAEKRLIVRTRLL
ncbi:MAG: nitroreductase family deazaflavin-dependent oxidoreductase [Anaerolineales bacterium]|nr:nitroreductase family deazaflavin-dependent oxidoreductase [Anaerolineales bacterium]